MTYEFEVPGKITGKGRKRKRKRVNERSVEAWQNGQVKYKFEYRCFERGK